LKGEKLEHPPFLIANVTTLKQSPLVFCSWGRQTYLFVMTSLGLSAEPEMSLAFFTGVRVVLLVQVIWFVLLFGYFFGVLLSFTLEGLGG
jgi:hypothetical protein